MPELPEVETVKEGLKSQILGKQIAEVIVRRRKIRVEIPDNIEEVLQGRVIKSLSRRSKYIIINVGEGDNLVIHLGMSGKVLYKPEAFDEYQKHDHFAIVFDDESQIIFNDTRRFGLIILVRDDEFKTHPLFKNLGLEPFDKGFDTKYLTETFKKKTIAIKQAVMDAKNLVGVGNIYASEALFRSKINPEISANKIPQEKLKNLAKNIQEVLEEAIKSGGSTLRDYVRSDGDIGYFQHNFKVYGREKQPCVVCSTDIKRITQQGRSTYFCPKCQK